MFERNLNGNLNSPCVTSFFSLKIVASFFSFCRCLVLSQLDAGLKDEACKSCTRAVYIANKHVPSKIMDLIRLQVMEGAGRGGCFFNVNSIFRRHTTSEIQKFSTKKQELHLQPVFFSNSAESSSKWCVPWKIVFNTPPICSAITYNALSGADLEQKLLKLFKSSSKEEGDQTPQSNTTIHLLGEAHSSLHLELGFLCLENGFPDLAGDCLHQVPKSHVQGNPKLLLHRELLHVQLLVAQHSNAGDIYTKTAMETRIKVITQLEELLKSALRISDYDVIQVSGKIIVVS